MKIIKDNYHNTIRVDCPECKSILEVCYKDVNYHKVFGHGDSIHIYCKACGSRIRLSSSALPDNWIKEFLAGCDEDEF